MMLDKSGRINIKKRLNEIDKKTSINRTEKNKLLKESNKISLDLEYKKKKKISSAFDSNDYYALKDLEYIFGDLIITNPY